MLVVLAGCGRLGFDDAGEGGGGAAIVDELDRGQLDGVVRGEGGVALASGGAAGVFTSRVWARPAALDAWTAIGWVPDAPYGKALPDGGGLERGYLRGNADMREAVAVLHLDGSGPVASGSLLADASGRGNDFRGVSTSRPGATAGYVAGVIGNALSKDVDVAFFRDVGSGDFQFGVRDFTWVTWVKSDRCSLNNSTYWGTEAPSESPHIWYGCCDPNGALGGYYRGSGTGGIGGCSDSPPITDGQWHHVAVVKTALNPTTVRFGFTLDGVPDFAVTGEADPDTTWSPTTRFGFTAFEFTRYPDSAAAGEFDEAVVLTRALDEVELRSLFERGALDLTLQVRLCATADCSDGGAFVGPDGTSATSFRDPSGTLEPPVPQSLAEVGDVTRPYLQFRASFSTRRVGSTPRLQRVTLR